MNSINGKVLPVLTGYLTIPCRGANLSRVRVVDLVTALLCAHMIHVMQYRRQPYSAGAPMINVTVMCATGAPEVITIDLSEPRRIKIVVRDVVSMSIYERSENEKIRRYVVDVKLMRNVHVVHSVSLIHFRSVSSSVTAHHKRLPRL